MTRRARRSPLTTRFLSRTSRRAAGADAFPATVGPAVTVVGAVGGAGTTTIAHLLGSRAVDCGRALPAATDRPLVIVTRSTAAGLAAAGLLLAESLRLGHYRPAVVVVSDAPLPVPSQARARMRLLRDAQRTRVVVELPYVMAWRDIDDPINGPAAVPKPVQSALGRLAPALAPFASFESPVAPSGAAVRTA